MKVALTVTFCIVALTPAFGGSRGLLEVTGIIEPRDVGDSGSADFVIQEIYYLGDAKVDAGESEEFTCEPDDNGKAPSTSLAVGERIPITWTKEKKKVIRLVTVKTFLGFELPAVGWDRSCGGEIEKLYAVFYRADRNLRSKTIGITNPPNEWARKFKKKKKPAQMEITFAIRLSWQKEYYEGAQAQQLVGSDDTVTNSASVTQGTAALGFTAPEAVDLSISQSDEPPERVMPGAELTYRVSVTNNSAKAQSATVTCELPEDVTFESTKGCAQDPGGWPLCDLDTISGGGTKSYAITVRVKPSATGKLINRVSVESDTTDSNLSNNSDSEETEVYD